MNQPQLSSTQTDSDKIINALDRMLTGIVRLFIGRITFDVLLERLKYVMVKEGCRRVAKENGGKIVKSRVALLTGIRTDQIGRSLQDSTEQDLSISNLTLEARILNAWDKDSLYRDNNTGKTEDLHIYGNGRTFQRLVSIHAGRGVTAQTVLDSLIKAGNIEIINQHWVRLLDPNWYHLSSDEGNMLNEASFAVTNLLNTIDWNHHNLEQADQKRLQRMVWSVSLPTKRIPTLRRRLNTVLKNCLDASRLEIRQQEDQEQSDYNQVLVGAGLYLWEYNTEDDQFVPGSDPQRRNTMWGAPVALDKN